jgi:serine/threonine protein kinase
MKLKQCGNVTKLIKIYESDKYINLLMDFHGGGTLGTILENKIKISEVDIRMIIA